MPVARISVFSSSVTDWHKEHYPSQSFNPCVCAHFVEKRTIFNERLYEFLL